MDPLEKVTLDGPKIFTYISSLLSNEEREQLRLMLLNNIDVFVWCHSNMIRINPTVASHKLNVIAPPPPPSKIESEAFLPRSPSDYSNESRQLAEGRFHQRSDVPRLASQCGGGSKGKW